MEFEGALSNRRDVNPVAVVVALIHINNQLHQYEAAIGILTYAQQHLGVQLKESWLLMLPGTWVSGIRWQNMFLSLTW
ncbi:hypothetical protein MTR67_017962 [Solanum verrucosum]|uniref:Uncharacterized protein n=1 Tax=Solanum verrucosum TaxID=315347 RepID=A0AAF0TL67_SOLVR|nr:hypothetical protein MTR67_017962 [Solanum verrucosum]